MTKLNLITDTKTTGIISGSCGVVGIGFKKVASNLGMISNEIYFPLSDKTSDIIIQKKSDVNIFFEELFPRAVSSGNCRNVVHYNVHTFGTSLAHENADQLIFTSEYLRRCFQHVFSLENQRECLSPMSVMPPISPTELFPRGYRNIGASFEFDSDTYSEYLIGHSLRPFKHDYLYTLEVLDRINVMAKKGNKRGALLCVPEITYKQFLEEGRNNGISQEVIGNLIPLPAINNKTLRKLMSVCDFSLCFDNVLEAFGFYPLESVAEMCPVYSNGSGNIRFLLPAGAGIEVYNNLKVHFGNASERKSALDEIGRAIYISIDSGKGKSSCLRGQKFIQKYYSEKKMTSTFKKLLKVSTRKKSHNFEEEFTGKAEIVLSPYVRQADLRKRQFITDLGAVSLPSNIQCESLLGKIFKREKIDQFADVLSHGVFSLNFKG